MGSHAGHVSIVRLIIEISDTHWNRINDDSESIENRDGFVLGSLATFVFVANALREEFARILAENSQESVKDILSGIRLRSLCV